MNWEDLQTTTGSDTQLMLLADTIEDGFPKKRHLLPPATREFFQFRDDLTGVLAYQDRLIIPKSMRPGITRGSPRHIQDDHQS